MNISDNAEIISLLMGCEGFPFYILTEFGQVRGRTPGVNSESHEYNMTQILMMCYFRHPTFHHSAFALGVNLQATIRTGGGCFECFARASHKLPFCWGALVENQIGEA